jgi:fibronectin type 3 domain-containing protein
VPQTLLASTRNGIPVTQLQWRGSTDPRVAGYRVYRREPDGRYVPLGASAAEGFLDISAQFGVMRTYAVSSYSRRGVESALSDPVNAAPEAKLVDASGDAVFANSFEGSSP